IALGGSGEPPLPTLGVGYRLDFGASFYLDRGVPADDQGSENRSGPSTQNGSVAFTTTHWSVVLEAQGPTPAAEAALEKLCRTYWWPLYGFVRRQGYTPEEAQDLTQGFFALLLERKDFESVRREKGRLRSYLLASLKHFMANERRDAMAFKRGGGRRLIPLEGLRVQDYAELDKAETLSADRLYDRRWALTVLDRVFTRLRDESKGS